MKRDWRLLFSGLSARTGLILILYGTEALIIYNIEFAKNPCGRVPGMGIPGVCSYPAPAFEIYTYWSGVGMVTLSILSIIWTFFRQNK